MKHLWPIGAAALLTLAACGSAPETPAQNATTATETAAHSTKDVAYLTRIRQTVTGGTDADLIKAGRHACDLYGNGLTALGVADALIKDGYDTATAATITTSATVYCPQYQE